MTPEQRAEALRLAEEFGRPFPEPGYSDLAAAAALLRELAAVPVGWQPIETAPKDGKENVLLSDGKTVSAGGWTTDLDAGAEYEGQLGMFGWWWIEGGNCAPTHWMPLPASPHTAR